MKKLFLLLASAFCLNASAAISDKPEDFVNNKYVEEWGRLKLVGNQLSAENGKPVQLKGWSTFSTHYGEVGGCLTEDQFKQMKQWGANIVRAALYINDHGGYSANPSGYTDDMKDYIDWTAKLDMYCLVDWHVLETEGGQSGDPHTYKSEAKTFFEAIGKHVQEKGYKHVIYEICNEPDRKPWSNIQSYANEILPVIAKYDENAVVVVGTPSWDQQILEAVKAPIRHNTLQIMYAFHYYACSHESLLGDLSSATSSIPVFISEWSGVNFDGNGNLCEAPANRMLAYCNGNNDGNQILSWCFWNWGYKDEGSSTFKNGCGGKNNLTVIGNYIVNVLGGDIELPDVPKSDYYKQQAIPSTKESPVQLGFYDNGGEGIAYHDANSELFDKNEDGEIKGYKNDAVNCNIAFTYSEGYNFRIGTTVDTTINVVDENGKTIEKSYTNVPSTANNCVDVAGCFGPGTVDMGWRNICWTEPSEWMNLTVIVDQPGYYSIDALVNKGTFNTGYFTLLKLGKNGGCMIRDINNKTNYELSQLKVDGMASCSWDKDNSWKCWQWNPVYNEEEETAYVLFTEAGEQKIKFLVGDKTVGDMGPLNFTFVEGIEELPADDPLLVGTSEEPEDPEETNVNAIPDDYSSIFPTDYGIMIYSGSNGSATISTAAGTSKIVNIAKGDNKINVAPGLYIVNLTTASASRVEKVLVK